VIVFVRLFKLSTMSDFRTCELCDVVFNAHTSNSATDPHRCGPAALVARIVALKQALKSERKRSKPKQGYGHAANCAVHNGPELPIGPCDCGAVGAGELRLTVGTEEPTSGEAQLGNSRAFSPEHYFGQGEPTR